MEPRERLSEGHGGHAWSAAAALARVAEKSPVLSTNDARRQGRSSWAVRGGHRIDAATG